MLAERCQCFDIISRSERVPMYAPSAAHSPWALLDRSTASYHQPLWTVCTSFVLFTEFHPRNCAVELYVFFLVRYFEPHKLFDLEIRETRSHRPM